MTLPDLLLALVLILLAAKLAGEGMERLGQTAVLGELLAGVLIGPGVFGLVHESEILHLLAEIGVIILLFEIGLESGCGRQQAGRRVGRLSERGQALARGGGDDPTG